jgi:hypothetical protein
MKETRKMRDAILTSGMSEMGKVNLQLCSGRGKVRHRWKKTVPGCPNHLRLARTWQRTAATKL